MEGGQAMPEIKHETTKLLTIPKTATTLQVPYLALLDGIGRGDIPFYWIGKSKIADH
jgi:hypothetical protein